MKNTLFIQYFWRGGLVVALLFLGVSLAQARIGAGSETEVSLAPATYVGTGFTYQGRLNKDGAGINDTCDFKFSSYADATLDFQNGATQTLPDVQVSDGYFTVVLNGNNEFGSEAFAGSDSFLEIEVKCSGDASYVPLTSGTNPRQELTAAPYAQGLRPGAQVYGYSQGVGMGSGLLSLWNYQTGGGSTALYAISGEDDNYWGYMAAETAIFGGSKAGYGVVGQSTTKAGVYGSSRSNYGVWGISEDGAGVLGQSTNGYAVYSAGPAYVGGDLSWQAKTSYISVSAAAFRPSSSENTFVNIGNYLAPSDPLSSIFIAPVQLPQGAVITSVTYYWQDLDSTVDANTYVVLERSDLDGTATPLMVVYSSGGSGNGSTKEPCTINCVVDNSQSAYFLEVNFTSTALHALYGVTIEYTISEPY
jgi:hypothetical protein